MSRCLTCRSEARPRAENAAFPFCSPRCKAIDLGKWFTEEYRVPGTPLAVDQRSEESRTRDGNPEQPEGEPDGV
jgi:endogenous inhibitor of DNA gyrase (YacG/DUF329 family)